MEAWEIILTSRYRGQKMRNNLESLFPAEDIDIVSSFDLSPLHLAVVRHTSKDLEKSIPTHRGSIDQEDASGHTALYWAAIFDAEKTSLLLAAGTNPNAETHSGAKTLLFAIESLQFDMRSRAAVNILLERNFTNVNAKNNFGGSALHGLCGLNDDIVNWEDFTNRGSREISDCSNRTIAVLFYTLLDEDLDIHSKTLYSQSLLYAAISEHAYTIIILLLDNGVDHKTSDYKNQTIL